MTNGIKIAVKQIIRTENLMEYTVNFAERKHLPQIISLNRKYLFNHLSDEQRQKGFIRIEYSNEDLERIIENNEIIVACEEEKVIGYYLIAKNAITQDIEYQRNKAKQLVITDNLIYENIGFGCQVCIDMDYRHYGLFKSMLDALCKGVKDKYTHLLCSVSDYNVASLKAHIKNGWKQFDKENSTNFFVYIV